MFMLYSFIEKGCSLKYIREPLVYWRSGNDSFGGPGKIQSRYMVDIDGFKKVMDTFFSNDPDILVAFRGVFRRHHPYKNITYLRLNTKSVIYSRGIDKKLVDDYAYDPFLLGLLRKDFIKYVLRSLFILNRTSMNIR